MFRYYESKEMARTYATYRFGYSNEAIETIMRYLKKKNNTSKDKFDLMVDVGCGSGQATKLFAPYFRKVVGIDISANQIAEANKANQMEHVSYCVGAAEKIDVADKSVDLVISDSAAHWFDLPLLFKELKRVLKTNGCVALFCFHNIVMTPAQLDSYDIGITNSDKTKSLADFLLKGVCDEGAYCHILDGYRKMFDEIPSRDKERIDTVENHYERNLEQVLGLLYSCDSTQNHMEAKMKEFKEKNVVVTDELLKSVDLVQQFRTDVRNDWNIPQDLADCDAKIKINAKLHLLMACHLE